MIDRQARQSLLERLQWIDTGQSPLDSLRSHPLETEDDAVPAIVHHLIANGERLPLSRRDDLRRPSPQGCEDVRRAIDFLRSDLEFVPPVPGSAERIVFVCLLIYLTGAIIELISQDRLILPVANPIRFITLAAGGVLLLWLLMAYGIALGIAAGHIFRVRVLGSEVSDLDPQGCWPFSSQEQFRRLQALKLTESVLP